MTPTNRDRARELADVIDRATPRPWKVGPLHRDEGEPPYRGEIIADYTREDGKPSCRVLISFNHHWKSDADADAVIAGRNLAPSLLRELADEGDAKDKEIERLKEENLKQAAAKCCCEEIGDATVQQFYEIREQAAEIARLTEITTRQATHFCPICEASAREIEGLRGALVGWSPSIMRPPTDTTVETLSEDGSIERMQFREHRQCMLSTVAPGAGELGPGWVSEESGWLPVDAPVAWREIAAEALKKGEGR